MNSTTIYNVTQINNRVGLLFDRELKNIFIRGEISSFKLYDSGHAYFTLKDSKSLINCVYFNYKQNKTSNIRDNLEVVAYGNVGLYRQKGNMQFIVSNIHIGEEGLLWSKYLKLKNKLEKEGLFDFEHKKKLPYIPSKIALISSKKGSVIHDIVSILSRRAPYLDIIVEDSSVQGEKTVPSIVKCLEKINSNKDVDLIIIARGGGSLEDMMPFNDELLVRQIFNSSIPIITAIGHETDFTLSDFAADRRASTPSEAAEICSPDISFLHNTINEYKISISNSFNNYFTQKKTILDSYYLRILSKNPKLAIQSYSDKLEFSSKLLINITNERMKYYKYSINQYDNKISNYNVDAIKSRGFFLIRKEGKLITYNDKIEINDYIDIESNECTIRAKVDKISEKDKRK